MKLIFVFLDGVGLAPRSPLNPFFHTPTRQISDAIGAGFFYEDACLCSSRVLFQPIDAGMSVEGHGQSGTGQFSIYTGLNGAKIFGRHHGPHLPSTLRTLLAQNNIYSRLDLLGLTYSYANAYPERFIQTCLDLREKGKIRSSVLFEGAVLQGLPILGADHVKRGEAISGDIINWWWGQNPHDGDLAVPVISSEEAAGNLLALSRRFDAVFFEFFLADLSGHEKIKTAPAQIIQRLDEFIGCLILSLPSDTLFVLTSDHGNFEDMSHTKHTLNPVPLLVVGKNAARFAPVTAIDQILPVLLAVMAQGREGRN
jgi:2,3-bisphosphoglycerate-independent phosphoglycerate mutase